METVSFQAAVRGYHFYKRAWQPQENEVLHCFHEYGNIHDMFAIKVCEIADGIDEIVGHLPIEVSRLTKFFLDRGASVTATLTSVSYRRSPLVQGGLEIPCLVEARMIGTQINKTILSKYLTLVNETYAEPTPEELVIVGTFIEEEKGPNLSEHEDDSDGDITVQIERNKKVKKKSSKQKVRNHDIRELFRRQNNKNKEQERDDTEMEDEEDDDELMITAVIQPRIFESSSESSSESARESSDESEISEDKKQE